MKKKIRKVLLVAFGSSLLLAQDRPQCNKEHDGWYWINKDKSVQVCSFDYGKYRWSDVLTSVRPCDTPHSSDVESTTDKNHWSIKLDDDGVLTIYAEKESDVLAVKTIRLKVLKTNKW